MKASNKELILTVLIAITSQSSVSASIVADTGVVSSFGRSGCKKKFNLSFRARKNAHRWPLSADRIERSFSRFQNSLNIRGGATTCR